MDILRLDNIKIVLVEPAGPLNIGSIARVMKNMGLQQLVLVNPHCDIFSAESQKMAVHAAELLSQATIVQTLTDALEGCQRVVATSARPRRLPIETYPPKQILPWLLDGPTALVFGPEDRGLSNAELYHAQACLQIPTNPAYSALNLAQAVTICCYELRQFTLDHHQGTTEGVPPHYASHHSPSPRELAPFQQKEEFLRAFEAILLEIGYLHPHTAKARMQKLRLMVNRGQLSPQEVAMLRGMIRQVDWKIQSN
ncbi:RNA methyltransferase [Acaryochloris sp. IP29b_bin.137]|uniref:RNA methyltransferase n=1 Tax=Acaryochloris sp. IP29b_bin.137 TaxID=2969217 RepID=UPI002609120D|nr:RNA methyltransferase [Acaryochloris sp. IP29b_bin.137]